VKPPLLEFDLEIPDQPFWNGMESSCSQQESFLNEVEAHPYDNFLGQRLDAAPGESTYDASQAPPVSIDSAYESIIPYSQNPVDLPESYPWEHASWHPEQLPPIERLWAGRHDPFARYPIEMNFRAHELIDHSQYPLPYPTSHSPSHNHIN
jgi:hypothetical protein